MQAAPVARTSIFAVAPKYRCPIPCKVEMSHSLSAPAGVPNTASSIEKLMKRPPSGKKRFITAVKSLCTDRSHLTGLEVGKLIAATRGTRNEARDRCLMLLMFRHGLRV